MKRKFPLSLDIQWFAQDPPVDPTQDPPADPHKQDKIVFTPEQQAEVDRIASERALRERKKFADYEDLKTKLTTLEAAEAERAKAAMTEAERIQADKDAALKDAETARADRDTAVTAANNRIIKSEFKALARELGVRADALEDAFVLADKTAVTVTDGGEVVGVKEAVEALLTAKPFLADTAKPAPRIVGEPTNHGGTPTQKTKEQLLAEAADRARKSGRIEDRAAYASLKSELNK